MIFILSFPCVFLMLPTFHEFWKGDFCNGFGHVTYSYSSVRVRHQICLVRSRKKNHDLRQTVKLNTSQKFTLNRSTFTFCFTQSGTLISLPAEPPPCAGFLTRYATILGFLSSDIHDSKDTAKVLQCKFCHTRSEICIIITHKMVLACSSYWAARTKTSIVLGDCILMKT